MKEGSGGGGAGVRRVKLIPQKKLPSKSPALLGLNKKAWRTISGSKYLRQMIHALKILI